MVVGRVVGSGQWTDVGGQSLSTQPGYSIIIPDIVLPVPAVHVVGVGAPVVSAIVIIIKEKPPAETCHHICCHPGTPRGSRKRHRIGRT